MNTLILVHGFLDSSKRMSILAKHLRGLGWKVLTPSLEPSNGSVTIESLALQLDQYIQNNTMKDERIDLIGFSMGGLICRQYLQSLGGISQTDRLVTISTPHKGTLAAYLAFGPGIKQMRPNSKFLKELNSRPDLLQGLKFVSFYTPYDLTIFPATSSVIPFAEIQRIPALLHPFMLSSQLLISKLAAILKEES